jgi:four helix bundle protein
LSNAPSTPATGAPAPDDAPLLDAERLDVYNVALEFQRFAATLYKACDGVLRDQLRRASASCVLNIAEGSGRRSRADKRQFYGIARGSAAECAAILDILLVQELVQPVVRNRGRALLVRIVQMLHKLDQRLA